jgi:DNA-3-methyladenine glycosylase II
VITGLKKHQIMQKQSIIFRKDISSQSLKNTECQLFKRPQGFETLVLLILEQQVSIDSAKATFFEK